MIQGQRPAIERVSNDKTLGFKVLVQGNDSGSKGVVASLLVETGWGYEVAYLWLEVSLV